MFFVYCVRQQGAAFQKRSHSVGDYIHYTSSGDDFATQQTTFISPEMFRESIIPYFQKRISLTKQLTKAKFLHHSCGNVSSLIGDLIECGVDILNPIQPTSDQMAPERLKAMYGDRIVFHGGLDTQRLLPHGNESSIAAGVEALLTPMLQEGGYVFAAAHNIQPDVPPENVIVMFREARKQSDKLLQKKEDTAQ